MPKTGRPKKIGPGHHPLLREIMTAKPLASMEEIGAEFMRRTGLRVHRNTLADAMADAMAEAGIKRTQNPRTAAENRSRSRLISRDAMAMVRPIAHRTQRPAMPAH